MNQSGGSQHGRLWRGGLSDFRDQDVLRARKKRTQRYYQDSEPRRLLLSKIGNINAKVLWRWQWVPCWTYWVWFDEEKYWSIWRYQAGSWKIGLRSFFKKLLFFVNFWLCWVFVAAQAVSLLRQVGATLYLWCEGLLLWLLLWWSTSSRARAQQLWFTGLAVLWHVGSCRIRNQIHASYIGRRILYHWDTRAAQFRGFEEGLEGKKWVHGFLQVCLFKSQHRCT